MNYEKPLYTSVSELTEDYGYNICVKNSKYICRCVIWNYVAVLKPYRISYHILAWKWWANVNREWYMIQWVKVAFGDESTFTRKPTSRRKRVWRKQGEIYGTVNMVPTIKSCSESIPVWGAFTMKKRTLLINVDENLIEQNIWKYCNKNCCYFQKGFMEARKIWYFNRTAVVLIVENPYRPSRKQKFLNCFNALRKAQIWIPSKMIGPCSTAIFANIQRILLEKVTCLLRCLKFAILFLL